MTFYVYTHSTPEGSVFYVGKGTGHRAYSSGKRPLAWREMVSKHNGICIKIVARYDCEQEAFAYERRLICDLRSGGVELINATDGGAGVVGYYQTEELRAHKRELLTGYKHKIVTCPNCGTVGGETSMKRWHFDNCDGARKFRARATLNGARIHIGRYATKEEADRAKSSFIAEAV